jgi:NAD(P)-dependent dehydrogenase (short-subunit alcohol dehydrogenase family)
MKGALLVKLKQIDQQVVVVVGCTSGIGLETTRRLAREGAKLVLAGRDPSDLDATLQIVKQEGSDGITVEADVANWDQVNNIAQRAIDTYGRIDTWAHIAGVSYYSKIEDMRPEEYRRVIDVNLNGPTYGIMAALPHLKREGRGAIIIISSVDAYVPLPYQAAYVAAKHGLLGMVDTLRLELKHDGIPISITNILPATINTPFFEKAKTRTGFEPNAIPPVYDPASVADAVVYAAQHPTRSISVGSASIIYQATRRISPRLSDVVIMASAFKGQQTDIQKSPDSPNHLWNHLDGYHYAESKYPSKYSITTWMQLHPLVTYLVGGVLLVGLPFAGIMVARNRMKRTLPGKVAVRITDIAVISAVAGLLSRLSPRKQKTLRQKIVSRAQDILPTNVFRNRRRTIPEKFLSKVQDIMPKGMFVPSRKSIPEKAIDRVKDLSPKDVFTMRKQSTPERMYNSAKETVQQNVLSAKSK